MRGKKTLSIGIFSSDGGITIHKTVLNAIQAMKIIDTITVDISLCIYSPTPYTAQYISNHERFFSDNNIGLTLLEGGNEVSAKNLFYKKVRSHYIFTIHGGNMFSITYLKDAVKKLVEEKAGATYCDYYIEFYNRTYHPCRMTEIPDIQFEDSAKIFSVLPNPIANSMVIDGAMIEDLTMSDENSTINHNYNWRLVCELLKNDAKIIRINHSCLYVRLERPCLSDDPNMIIPSNPLHTPSYMNNLRLTEEIEEQLTHYNVQPENVIKNKIKVFLDNQPTLNRFARTSLHNARKLKTVQIHNVLFKKTVIDTNEWVIKDSHSLHSIEPKIYIYSKKEAHKNKLTRNTLENVNNCGLAYKIACKYLNSDTYDYIVLVPWLIAGGADMFFVNYANTVAKARPTKNVLVIATQQGSSSLKKEAIGLSDEVDFLPLSEIIPSNTEYEMICQQILALVIENTQPAVIHVANSLMGYMFIEHNKQYIKDKHIKIITTGYNEVINSYGQRLGYVHEFIPNCYNEITVITTDNQSMIDMWQSEYGFAPSKMLLHHQPFKPAPYTKTTFHNTTNTIRVLWASHVRKEKNPEAIIQLAKWFEKDSRYQFDCYGAIDKTHYPINPFTREPSNNLSYKGGYTNFFQDIDVKNYDIFVYTSMFDGTPNMLIEVGLAKLPIISSATGGIPQLLGKYATLIKNPNDIESYAKSLKSFAENNQPFIDRSHKLEAVLSKNQTYAHFNNEIEHMLKIVNY